MPQMKCLACFVLLFSAVYAWTPENWAQLRRTVMRNATLVKLLEEEAATVGAARLAAIEADVVAQAKSIKSCPSLTPREPASIIQDLHVADIGALGAIGDSITMGCNSKSTTWLNHKNYVGISWSMGGDPGIVTLPNLFRPYTGAIPAPSLGEDTRFLGLNAAVDGAVAGNMAAQATDLVTRFKSANYLNGQTYETAWKVATILIGGNNFCDVCNDRDTNSVAQFEANMRGALNVFRDVPRLFVNVMPMLDIGPLANFRNGLGCELALRTVCPCVMTDAGRLVITEFTRLYNAALINLIKDYPTTSDWAVVSQPFLINTQIPNNSYITPADCFHPSPLGQSSFAIAIWNNMLSPMAEKSHTFVPGEAPKCPTDDTLVYVN